MVRCLALGGGDIGEQGARELARTLKANNSLTELYLSNNNIGKVTLDTIVLAWQ
ncbi:hypothetical protein [Rickettsia helvetica]|uniref:hypothetical protein n=1 Tax=Rickettsia helvetica TaxID=35789 RepID=UPI0012E9F482|nr:hypothetical protein [Rickettsia helvetica]MCZ6883771.1 hypothetical protein [Rickettsia endosymbiont of Ixodes ricinus]